MRKTALFLVIVFLMLGACGCSMRKENVQDRMLKYINEKYDDTFEFKSVFGGSAGSKTKKIIVSSAAFPNKDVYVICNNIDGVEVFTDNYLGVKFENETKNRLSKTIVECFGTNCYIKYFPNNLACTEGGSSSTTFEEYIAEDSSHVSFEATVVYKSYSMDHKCIEETIQQHFAGMAVVGRIYFVDADVNFDGVNGEELFTSCIETKQYFNRLYFIKSENDFNSVEWTE